MSAIWGFIDFCGEGVLEDTQKLGTVLKSGYAECKIDRYGEYIGKCFCMGCGIQYFTPESKNEILPIVDEDNGRYFTADAIIDNRQELLSKLGYGNDDGTIPDARIIYELFSKYGETCLNDMLGIYTFVYYDSKKGICYLVNDAIGNRAIQYAFEDGKLYFSTLTQPICMAKKKSKANKQWFADFLGIDTLAYSYDYESTPYEGIMRLPAASCYKFEKDKITKNRYWHVEPSVLKLNNDDEYKKKFIETYINAVERVVRNEKMTMLLSGGLDSTSVVCMLANSKKKNDIKLRTYTSVPCKEYKKERGHYGIANESQEVLKTKAFLRKINFDFETEFIDLDGINLWDERIKEEKCMEMPYKSILNQMWMKKALEKSYDYGARIVLYGAFGNTTISLDIGNVYLYYLYKHNFLKFIYECLKMGRLVHMTFVTNIRTIKNLIMDFNANDENIEPNLEKTLLTTKAIEQYKTRERLKKEGRKKKGLRRDFNLIKRCMFHENAFYNFTEIETRHSLMTGAVFRDPTADKRVIEFCSSLPIECYGKGDAPRRLVRSYLKDFMPEGSQNISYYGEQSADLGQRLMEKNGITFDEIIKAYEKYKGSELVDIEKSIKEVERLRNDYQNAKAFELCRIVYSAMALEMIDTIDNLVG